MTLPSATLFPQALLPLYIFEPRYRRMLSDALKSDRMFTVAMQKPGRTRETPCTIAGLGLIRASVDHRDGSSHLILQGLTRVMLKETVRYKPYRIQNIRLLETAQVSNPVIDDHLHRIFDLVRERLEIGGLPYPLPIVPNNEEANSLTEISPDEVLGYLESMKDPEQIGDLVACAVLQNPVARQIILENMDLEERLEHLVHFLLQDIQHLKKDKSS